MELDNTRGDMAWGSILVASVEDTARVWGNTAMEEDMAWDSSI